MDPLVVALIAAGAIAAVVGVVLLTRRGGPGPPAKTVSQFQESREHLASVESPTGPDSDVPDPAARSLVRSLGKEDHPGDDGPKIRKEPEDEPAAPPAVTFEDLGEEVSGDETTRPSESGVEPLSAPSGNLAPGPELAEPPKESVPAAGRDEVEEVASLIRSISSDSPDRGKKQGRPPKRKKHKGPITVGRTTYVLVDEEGRPQLGD